MTDIDPQADIELRPAGEHVTVSVPLAGAVTGDQGKVAATMDAARALIAEADAAAERSPAAAKAEASIRDWWAGRGGNPPSSPVPEPGTVRAEAEKRWPMAFTLVLAMAVPLLLPARFSLGQPWAVPALEAILLVAIIVIDRGRIDRRSASDLLKTGFLVWLYTIIAFSFLYWVLDGGGHESRFLASPQFPDLAFPEQLNPQVAPPGWRPEFFDYLYLGFTDATALSPTDVMPLARWGKLVMTVQAVGSLMILGLVIARAVNILK